MKVVVKNGELKKAVGILDHVTKVRSFYNYYAYIHVDKLGYNSVKLSATNNVDNVEVILSVNTVEIEDDDNKPLFFDSDDLLKILRLFDKESLVSISSDDEEEQVKIECENSKYKFRSANASEYRPFHGRSITIEKIRDNARIVRIKSSVLLDIIQRISRSIGDDKSHINLNAIFIHAINHDDKKHLSLMTTDRYIMNICEINQACSIDFPGELKVLINGSLSGLIADIIKTYPDDEGWCNFYFYDNTFAFEFNSVFFIASLLDGNFVDYRDLMAKHKYDVSLVADSEQIISSVKRFISVIGKDKILRLGVESMNENDICLNISGNNPEESRTITECLRVGMAIASDKNVTLNGYAYHVSPSRLLEALLNYNGANIEVRIGKNSPTIKITHSDDGDLFNYNISTYLAVSTQI